ACTSTTHEVCSSRPRFALQLARPSWPHIRGNVRRAPMTITPGELLDTSIAQLQTLAAFLADQLSTQRSEAGASPAADEVRICREALVSLGALINELGAARQASAPAICANSLDAPVEQPSTIREPFVQSVRRRPSVQSRV